MIPKKFMVIGGRGQLGSDIVQALSFGNKDRVICLTHKDIDIRDIETVDMWVKRFRPYAVINTAAFHDLDKCEDDVERSFGVNTVAVRNLSEVCDAYNTTLVHFSTDYVFGGDIGPSQYPYSESSPPIPINVYGMSKLAGELMAEMTHKHYILRVSSLYGHTLPSGKPHNFPTLMLKLARERGKVSVVNDQWMTPTHTLNIAKRVRRLFDEVPYGLYHCSDGGRCTWYDFAKRIFKLKNIEVETEPVNSSHFPTKARRPLNSALDSSKLKFYVKHTPAWEDAVEEYLKGVV